MESWTDQVAAAHAEVIDDIRTKFKSLTGGPSVLEGVKGFIAAVDWSERWIIALLVAQALLFISVLANRKNTAYQGIVFFVGMALVFSAESLNALAGRHWRSFSTQDYFQGDGLFTSALLSAPLLLTMFAVVLNYLIETVMLMVEMKRKELIYKARRQARQQQGGGGGAGGGGEKKTR